MKKNFFKDKATRIETLKSVLVGIICTVLDVFLVALVVYIDAQGEQGFFAAFSAKNSVKSGVDRTGAVILGTGLGFVFSSVLNYFLSVFFVFHYGNVGKNKKGFLKFLIFAAAGFAVSAIGQFVGYNLLGLNMWIVKAVLIVICFVGNYFARKHYIFNIYLIIDEEKQIDL